MRDCNTCRHHRQGEHPPSECKTCLAITMGGLNTLPFWEPITMHSKMTLAPVGADVLERSDLSPHAIVTDYKAPCENNMTCTCGPGMCEYPSGGTVGKCKAVTPVPITPPKHVGLGGGTTRATTLPDAPSERKKFPVASGVLDYFPDAIVAIAGLSYVGNEQHNRGKPLHWDRSKSTDEADTMLRHFLQRGTLDIDGIRHSAKMAWRALAILQKEIEGDGK